MKNLIFINGTMGVGKTKTSRELQKLLPHNVFLDGDWCWDMEPFVLTQETKSMVVENIAYLLNNYLNCSAYENVLFCWVMHEQAIVEDVLSRLHTADCRVRIFSLTCSGKALAERLSKDVKAGIRKEDIIRRSIVRLEQYSELSTEKIDVSRISAKQAAELIFNKIQEDETS